MESVIKLALSRPTMCVDWSGTTRLALGGGMPDANNTISLLEVPSLAHTLLKNGPLTRSVAFSPSGVSLLSGGRDGRAIVWDVESAAANHELRHDFPVLGVAWSPDGSLIATAAGDPQHPGQLGLWDSKTAAFVRVFRGHESGIYSVSFSPDGRRIASSGIDHTIRVHSVADGTELMVLRGHTAPSWTVQFDPSGARIASGAHDASVRIWNASDGALIATLQQHGDFVTCVRWSPNGALLASASHDRTVRLWDAANAWQNRGTIGEGVGWSSQSWAIAFNSAGDLAVTGLDGAVHLVPASFID